VACLGSLQNGLRGLKSKKSNQYNHIIIIVEFINKHIYALIDDFENLKKYANGWPSGHVLHAVAERLVGQPGPWPRLPSKCYLRISD
jgi:hypothetical protein